MNILLSLFLSLSSYCAVQVSSSLSKPLSLMTEHIEKYKDLDQKGITSIYKSINSSGMFIQEDIIQKVIESSINRKILDNSLISKDNKSSISSNIIKRVENKIRSARVLYSPFSLLIIEGLVDDYKTFYISGFIDRYESFSRSNQQELRMYQELKALNARANDWLSSFLNFPAKNFNQLVLKVSIEILEQIKTQIYFYKTFTPPQSQEISIFTINKKKQTKVPPKKPTPKLRPVDELDVESISKEIDKIIPKSQ